MAPLMQYYELLYIIPAQEDVEVVKTRVGAILTGQGMEVLRHEEAGRFRLAYPMHHVRQGVYELALFRGDARKINVIESALRLERTVVRTMIARVSEAAKDRRIPLAVFEQPVLERSERRSFSGSRAPRRFGTHVVAAPPARPAAPVAAPAPATAVVAKPMSEEEIEHEIDKILEEKVL